MNEDRAREILVEIIEGGEFPDCSVEIRHLEKATSFECVAPNRVQFWIERHPHIFGRPSLGLLSSAFVTVDYLYELDIEKKKVTLIEKKQSEPIIDYGLLADEDVRLIFEGNCYDDAFSRLQMQTKEDVVEFATKEFENYDWEACLISDVTLPENFMTKYLNEVKGAFIEEMLLKWEYWKEEDQFL